MFPYYSSSFFLLDNINPATNNAADMSALKAYISQRMSSKSLTSEATKTPVRKYLETSIK